MGGATRSCLLHFDLHAARVRTRTLSRNSGNLMTSPAVGHRVRPYLYYDTAISICSTCYQRIDAKIVFEDAKVWMLKRCPQHGFERVLVADDVDYYRRS